MIVRDAPQKLKMRPDKPPPSTATSAGLQPWEEKQQQIEASVNQCFASAAGSAPLYSFEARRKFSQVLSKQQRASDEQALLAQEEAEEPPPRGLDGSATAAYFRTLGRPGHLGGSTQGLSSGTFSLGASATRLGAGGLGGGATATQRGAGRSAPPRGAGAGSHSLMAHEGIRSHFHNTAAIHTSGGHSWPSTMDVHWDGSHIDHTKQAPQKADAKFSTMSREERGQQFSTYFKGNLLDCAALKARAASDHSRDAERYGEWRNHEFRADAPHRHGKHGRRHFDPQVREKPVANRYSISEIENKPQEEVERHGERVRDFLDRKLPQGQQRHFQSYQPLSQQPGKYEDIATREPIRSSVVGELKRHALGFGQTRHTGPGDPNLYTRPLGVSQMDRLLPLA